MRTAQSALLVGGAVTAAILAYWIFAIGVDRIGLASFLLRWLHVLASIVWLGQIAFINFVQIVALNELSGPERAGVVKAVVPRVATLFRHASHLTVVTGILLLVTTGYLLDRWVFSSAVYVPPLRNLFLWGGTLGGLAMWAIAHFIVWPNLKVVLGLAPGDDAAKAAARARVERAARLNLVLALPVTFVMVAASHLY